MRQLHDEDLILYFYGESEDPEEIRTLLAASPELSARYDALRRTLEAAGEALPVPERPESYGAEVWERIRPRLAADAEPSPPAPLPRAVEGRKAEGREAAPRKRWLHTTSRRALAAWAAAAALLLAVGFLAGRLWPRPGDEPRVAETALPAEARERILTRTVATHLERSERLLAELANAEAQGTVDSTVDISAERRWAQDLLSANRLYRQITRREGRPMLSSLLDDLEPFLLELVHSPSDIAPEDLADLRARIEEQALLFKMRVVSQRLERKPIL